MGPRGPIIDVRRRNPVAEKLSDITNSIIDGAVVTALSRRVGEFRNGLEEFRKSRVWKRDIEVLIGAAEMGEDGVLVDLEPTPFDVVHDRFGP